MNTLKAAICFVLFEGIFWRFGVDFFYFLDDLFFDVGWRVLMMDSTHQTLLIAVPAFALSVFFFKKFLDYAGDHLLHCARHHAHTSSEVVH